MKILDDAKKVIEEARAIIYLKKEYAERDAYLRKLQFSKDCTKDIKSMLSKCARDKKVLEVASQLFLKKHGLPDDFMSKLEDSILAEMRIKT